MSESSSESAQPAAQADTRAGTPGETPRRHSAWPAALLALAVAVMAAAFSAWQWHHGRNEIGKLRQDVAKRLADNDTQAKESRIVAEQLRQAVADAQVKLGVLESRVAESQNQQIALEALYQELSRNRDEWSYAEIEQSLFIATQQLALAGNVKAALIALQNADARLQRMDRPQVTALRKAINRDIERLKAVPHVDTVAISVRLDNLIGQVDKMPLAMEVRPPPEQAAREAPAVDGNWWTRLWRETWSELRQLVRVQHMNQPDVPLLAPAQSYFLRENLKLRLIGARLALLSRDGESYKADLKAARDWLTRYYEKGNSDVAYALGALRNLHDADVSIEAPDIAGTLEAARALRVARDRSAR
jgi:uroporphyrin-3 C-methyltransferase